MKKKLLGAIDRFSFAQMTSNANGKTSGSGTMGVLICTIGSICFFMGCIDKMFINKSVDVITQSIIFVGIGVGLLGFRKSKDGSNVEIAKIENGANVEIAKIENGVTDTCECPEGCECETCQSK